MYDNFIKKILRFTKLILNPFIVILKKILFFLTCHSSIKPNNDKVQKKYLLFPSW